jgi:hypothetical protein
MTTTDQEKDLESWLALLAREEARQPEPGAHLSSEALAAYRAGEAAPEEADLVLQHLVACRQCADLLLDLERFYAPAPAALQVDRQTAREWKQFRARLEGKPWFREERSEVWKLWWPQVKVPLMAAAAALVVIVGLYAFMSPRSRFQTLDGGTRGSEQTIKREVVKLPITLLLKRPLRDPLPEYAVEIRDGANRLVRSIDGLEESSSYEIEVPLWRWALAPGDYTLHLLGLDNGKLREIEEYGLRVANP